MSNSNLYRDNIYNQQKDPMSLIEDLDEQVVDLSGAVTSLGYNVAWNALLALDGDWTDAINTALVNNKLVQLPGAKLKVNGTVVINSYQKLRGKGRGVTIIESQNSNSPIISVSGKFTEIKDLTLKRKNWTPPTDPNAVGIKLGANSFVGQSVFEQLEIYNNYRGIDADNTTNVYSCTFRDLWIYVFGNWGISLQPYGSTGCVLDNIYFTNWNDYTNKTKFTAKGGLIAKNYSEIDIRQMNVEHGIYEYATYLGDCDTANIRTLHVEGYEQTGDYKAVVMTDGGWTDIDELSVVFSAPNFDRTTLNPVGVTQWNLLGVGRGGRVSVRTLSNRNNYTVEKVGGGSTTVNTTGMINNYAYNADGTQTYRDTTKIRVEKHRNKDSKFTTTSGFSDQGGGRTHQIEMYDGNKYYELLSDGRVINYFKKSLPTSGLWKQGDRILNVSNTAGTYSDLKCNASGHFNPPASTVTASTTQWTLTVTLNQGNVFTVGDRITIAGSTRTFNIVSTSNGGTTLTLDVNVEVTLTNAVVQYAAPTFKGMGMIEA